MTRLSRRAGRATLGWLLHGVACWWDGPGPAQGTNTNVETIVVDHRRTLSVAGGIAAGLLLHALAGGWSDVGFAQGSTNTTFTTSTSSSTSFESPPACSPVGSSRSEETVTLEHQIGPGTITIGNRDEGGTPFAVLAGTENFNANVHTETIQCVAAVPALPWPALLGLGGLLGGAAFCALRRRSWRTI